MRSLASPYPVDRYLVESSKKFEMVNIIDDDIWNTEPALKPEDELILRKLHDTLQSTADDLKLLSGELTKFREPGVQVKTTPTPLDEEFNEKVHIEEIVNAKFHGYKIIDKSALYVPENKSTKETADKQPSADSKYHKTSNINAPVNVEKVNKKPIIHRNLGITRTKVIQISGDTSSTKTEKLNNGTVVNAPTVAYNEYSYVYVEPKPTTSSKKLQVQEMPSINIRSELKEQKVLQLDIMPEVTKRDTPDIVKNNVTVVAIHHETCKPVQIESTMRLRDETLHQFSQPVTSRKVSKMSTYDSSGSTNNISSDTKIKLKTQKRILTNIRTSPKMSARSDRKKKNIKKEPEQRAHLNMEEWRKKLNSVYGATSLKKTKSPQSKTGKPTVKKSNIHQENKTKTNNLNNTEYIPYSKLTVGGARASDIEREISDIPNKKDIPLSPILDRILTSRENSFSLNSSQTRQPNDKPNIFTTSDENLLQEVIDIEKTVSETLSKNLNNINSKIQIEESESDEVKENDSYADDFEEEKTDGSGQSGNRKTNTSMSNEDQKSFDEENYSLENNDRHKTAQSITRKPISSPLHTNVQLNETYKKSSNLSFKNKVDVFEYVHSVDTQDSATQSNTELKLSRKETQTSPVNDNSIQPIHNDLWPSIDPKGEVEKMFQMEKEFIKKLIVEEYGDLLEKNIDKPSTSKEVQITLNVAASQKNTQTSPAHVKNVMTSPTKTKTRTTSPFSKVTVDHHTSPLIFVVDEDDVKLDIENEDEPGISINLSSPRFSLRLPRTSREVLSNLGNSVPRTAKQSASRVKNVKKNNITTSTSSFEADSSEISSLGEVKLARKLSRARVVSETDSVSSSSMSEVYSGILPLRSEGEMSVSHKQKSNKQHKSEGEASVGLF